MRISERHLSIFPDLRAFRNTKNYVLRLKYLLLKEINELFKNNLNKIDLRRVHDTASLGHLVHRSADLIFPHVKFNFMQQVFDNTAEDNTPPKLVIDQFALSSDISVP